MFFVLELLRLSYHRIELTVPSIASLTSRYGVSLAAERR
jgi:hypothetical protein